MTEKLGNPFKISELVETVNNLVDTSIDDSNLVHKTGNETITGTKTFTSSMTTNNILPKGDITLGTSTNTWGKQLQFRDTTGKRIARIQPMAIDTTDNRVGMWVNNADNSVEKGIFIDSDGTTQAPTPATSDNSTKIATTAFVKAQGYAVDSGLVHTTGNQTITGSKTFTSYQYIKNVDCSIANPPASTSWKYIDCIDSNNVRIGVIGSQINTNGTRGVYLQAGNEGNISIFTDGTTAYTSTVTPATSDNSTKIATTAWVKNQGYMSSGNIFPNNTWVSVGDDAYIGDHNQGGAVCIKGNNNSTGIYLYRRDETAFNGFYLDENDINGLKIFSPTQGATAWGSVTAMMAQSLSGNGYVKFNHGLIIQWGRSSSQTITYPKAFSLDTSFSIVINNNADTNGYGRPDNLTSITKTTCQTSSLAGTPIRWLAIGY